MMENKNKGNEMFNIKEFEKDKKEFEDMAQEFYNKMSEKYKDINVKILIRYIPNEIDDFEIDYDNSNFAMV